MSDFNNGSTVAPRVTKTQPSKKKGINYQSCLLDAWKERQDNVSKSTTEFGSEALWFNEPDEYFDEVKFD